MRTDIEREAMLWDLTFLSVIGWNVFSVNLTKNMVADAFYKSYSNENKDILPNLNFFTQTMSSVNANESAISASSPLAVPTLLLKLDFNAERRC